MHPTDAVHIVSEVCDPAGQVLDAIHRRSTVVCDVPVTSVVSVANAIRDASILNGVPVLAALPFLSHPQHRYALDLLRSGAIGELREVRAQLSSAVLTDDGTAGPTLRDPWFPASFVVAAVRSIIGAGPTRVIGWAETDDSGTDTGFAGTFLHADGVTASVAWSIRAGYGAGYTLVGTHGVVEVPNAFLASGDELRAQSVVLLSRADGTHGGRSFPYVDVRAHMLDALTGSANSVDDIVATADTFDLVRFASARPSTTAQRGQQWNLSPSA